MTWSRWHYKAGDKMELAPNPDTKDAKHLAIICLLSRPSDPDYSGEA